jgi:hypothetical protein
MGRLGAWGQIVRSPGDCGNWGQQNGLYSKSVIPLQICKFVHFYFLLAFPHLLCIISTTAVNSKIIKESRAPPLVHHVRTFKRVKAIDGKTNRCLELNNGKEIFRIFEISELKLDACSHLMLLATTLCSDLQNC